MRERQIVPTPEIIKLFSNIEVIAPVNKEVALELEARKNDAGDQILGDIFLRMADFFKVTV